MKPAGRPTPPAPEHRWRPGPSGDAHARVGSGIRYRAEWRLSDASGMACWWHHMDRQIGVQIAGSLSGASKPARAFRRVGLSCPSKTERKCSSRGGRDIPREAPTIRPRSDATWASWGGKRGTADQQGRNAARGTQFAGGRFCCGRMPPADEHQWCEVARADSVIKSARDNALDQPMAVKRNPCRIGSPDV